MEDLPPSGKLGDGQRANDSFGKIRLNGSEIRQLFHSCPIPLWIFNLDTLHFLEANAAALNMYGYSRQEFCNKAVTDMFPEGDAGTFLDNLNRSSVGFSRTGVWRQQAREGKVMEIELIWAPLTMEGERYGLLAAAEITERRWAEQLLLEVHAHTEGELGSRTMELDAATREMEALTDALPGLALEKPAWLEQFCASLHRLAQMTYQTLRRQDLDVSEMMRSVADEVRRAYPLLRIEFQIQGGVQAHADPELLRIALTDLVRNALAGNREGRALHVEFGARAEGQEVSCYVSDDGMEFDPAKAEKLSLPFPHQSSPSTREIHDLSMVRRIIAKHSGRVWTEARPTGGAIIHFTLPSPDE